eukprot:364577-Chlamydomonas_euryale.AAC.7
MPFSLLHAFLTTSCLSHYSSHHAFLTTPLPSLASDHSPLSNGHSLPRVCSKRCNVVEALEHPWLAQLHDPTAEPFAPGPFEFEFEEEQLTEQTIRELVFEEARHYHPA